MIGIYLITNKINGKIYVGRSNDIQRRWKEHCSPTRYLTSYIPLKAAIHKYGKENFELSILEECTIEELNDKETYWIKELDSVNKGYNCNEGGQYGTVGSQNPNASLDEEDIKFIRTQYQNHESKKETYEQVKNKITWSSFDSVWNGSVWSHIMPEVFTEENKLFYSKQKTMGESSLTSAFTNEEVINLRKAYVNQTAKDLYTEEIKQKISYQGFQGILAGQSYKLLPFYSKKENKWYYNGERPAPSSGRSKPQNTGGNNPMAKFTDEEVISFRNEYVTSTAREIYEKYSLETKVSYDSFQKIINGKTYKHLPVYSKKLKQWTNN